MTDGRGLSWSDLKFQCMPVPFYNGHAMRKIEQLLRFFINRFFHRPDNHRGSPKAAWVEK
jgi:hypothetical protein